VKCAYQGLKKSERLSRKSEFDRVYRNGNRLVTPFFVAYILWKNKGQLRLGVVASRKVGNSVLRGRAKRRLREAFRLNRPESAVSADLVLIARAAINAVGYKEIEKEYVQRVYRELENVYRDHR
jgi:ribonuclease P protein component